MSAETVKILADVYSAVNVAALAAGFGAAAAEAAAQDAVKGFAKTIIKLDDERDERIKGCF